MHVQRLRRPMVHVRLCAFRVSTLVSLGAAAKSGTVAILCNDPAATTDLARRNVYRRWAELRHESVGDAVMRRIEGPGSCRKVS